MTRPTKDELMMTLAVMISRMSCCRRLKTGCVLTDDRYEQIAVGYNGPHRGGPNECLRDEPGNCGCVHAETNAAIKCRFYATRAFVSDSPCELCASAMINLGIETVNFAREYRRTEGLEALERAGVKVIPWGPSLLVPSAGLLFDLDLTGPAFGWRT